MYTNQLASEAASTYVVFIGALPQIEKIDETCGKLKLGCTIVHYKREREQDVLTHGQKVIDSPICTLLYLFHMQCVCG